MKGGTGYTMDVCKQNNIPIIDQREWFNWLKELINLQQTQVFATGEQRV